MMLSAGTSASPAAFSIVCIVSVPIQGHPSNLYCQLLTSLWIGLIEHGCKQSELVINLILLSV